MTFLVGSQTLDGMLKVSNCRELEVVEPSGIRQVYTKEALKYMVINLAGEEREEGFISKQFGFYDTSIVCD